MNPPVYLELTGRLIVVEQEGGIVAPGLFLDRIDPDARDQRPLDMRDLLAAVNPGRAAQSDSDMIDVAAEVLGAFDVDGSTEADARRRRSGRVDLGPVRIVIMTKPDPDADVWTIVDGGE